MSVLGQLATELGVTTEELRSALFAGDEALTPTYLTVDTAGRVQAIFNGLLQAQGIQLPGFFSGSGGQPQSFSRVEWLSRTSILQQYVEGDEGGGLSLWARGNPPSSGLHFGTISLQCSNANTPLNGEERRTLLDDAGVSDFLQTGNIVLFESSTFTPAPTFARTYRYLYGMLSFTAWAGSNSVFNFGVNLDSGAGPLIASSSGVSQNGIHHTYNLVVGVDLGAYQAAGARELVLNAGGMTFDGNDRFRGILFTF